jgi:hypothetical protein
MKQTRSRRNGSIKKRSKGSKGSNNNNGSKSNGTRTEEGGWIKISVSGNAYDRGYAHGSLLRAEIAEFLKMYEFYMPYTHGRPLDYFVDLTVDFMLPAIRRNYNEFYQEMRGIAAGAGVHVNRIVFLNCSISMPYLYDNLKFVLKHRRHDRSQMRTKYGTGAGAGSGAGAGAGADKGVGVGVGVGVGESAVRRQGADDRCSAFIATGSYTKDGGIVCAHNSFDAYIEGQYANILLEIKPARGFAMTMQSFPGYIFSATDFFVTSAGIIGTETTIGGFNKYENRDPICCRIRQCMQYGRTMDDYVAALLHRNSGDYANSWLFGDINTGEIMRFELGLEYYNVERTRDGAFIGCNIVEDVRIRNLECDKGATYFDDIRHSQGARKVRLTELMEMHRGELDIVIASKIIADHYDVYLKKTALSDRGICKHSEYDDASISPDQHSRPFNLRGAFDGAVTDSKNARNMSMFMRFGSSCGTPFNAAETCKKHPQWKHLLPYLKNRPRQPWIKV